MTLNHILVFLTLSVKLFLSAVNMNYLICCWHWAMCGRLRWIHVSWEVQTLTVSVWRNLNWCVLCYAQMRYSLCGVIVHNGTMASSGHYTAIVRENNNWLLCDDRKVSHIQWQLLTLDATVGGWIADWLASQRVRVRMWVTDSKIISGNL